jgi:uncharacterized membrane protein YciS (DUF1049 family)
MTQHYSVHLLYICVLTSFVLMVRVVGIRPLLTRWWTIGCLSSLYAKYSELFNTIAMRMISSTTTSKKQNVIASNYIRFTKSDWIMLDVLFVAGICDGWMNCHLNWYQQGDTNIKKAGYLTFHRSTRFFIMLEDLKALEYDDVYNDAFSKYKITFDHLDVNIQLKKQQQSRMFYSIMTSQLYKHNKRYLAGSSFIRTVYAERKIAVIAIRMLTQTEPLESELTIDYESKIHNKIINLNSLYLFWRENISDESLTDMVNSDVFKDNNTEMNLIITHHIDVWEDKTEIAALIRKKAMLVFASHPSTNHNNERLVKVASRMIKTGKKERSANSYFIAANGYTLEDFDINNNNNNINDIRKRTRLNLCQQTNAFIETTQNKINEYKDACEYMLLNNFPLKAEIFDVSTLLVSTDNNIKIQMDKQKASTVVAATEDYNENARTKFLGMEIPPLFNGYIEINKFCASKNIPSGIVEKEFISRSILPLYVQNRNKVNSLKTLLRVNEKQRFALEVDEALQLKNVPMVGNNFIMSAKLAALKQTLIDNNELTCDFLKFEVDTSKYFKKQSNEYNILAMLDN